MQINKKGKIVNPPQFNIHGDKRTSLKKKLASKKHIIKMFWQVEDVMEVYGCAMEREEAEQRLAELKTEVAELEKRLAEPFAQ